MRKKHRWIIFGCVTVFILLTYPFLREMYFGFFVAPADKYLSETRRDELSRFAEEMLKNSKNSKLAVHTHGYGGPRADGPTSEAEIKSIEKLLRRHNLCLFRMDKHDGYVEYSHYFVTIWLHYIYVTDGGHAPTRPGSANPNPRKVFENWYFTAE